MNSLPNTSNNSTAGSPRPLLIVSDVDGTLIDHEGRLPFHPLELRERLKALGERHNTTVTLALASSRTLRELTVLQCALGIPGPCIAEDGALVALDCQQAASDAGLACGAGPGTGEIRVEGRRRLITEQLAPKVSEIEKLMQDMPAFHQADVRKLSLEAQKSLGFRTTGALRRALAERCYSVLLDPEVLDEAALFALHQRADSCALHLQRGGRWLTLTAARGKGVALDALRRMLKQNGQQNSLPNSAKNKGEGLARAGSGLPGYRPLCIAIGNEENDLSLLAAADLRFVIRNPQRGPHESLAKLPGAVVADSEGPGGWIDMLNQLNRDLYRVDK